MLFSASILGLAGCAGKPQPVVYVDTARIVSPIQPPVESRTEILDQPAGGGLTLPRLPEATLSMGSVGPSLERARRIREENKQRAFDEVYRRLRAVAFETARKESESELAALEPGYREAMDGVYLDARPLFERFAQPAFGYRVRLSNLVGFPDPDPKSRRQPDNADDRAKERFEKSKELRGALDELSALFWLEFDRSRVAVESDLSAKKAQIRVKMVERQERLDAEAKAQAREVVNGHGNGHYQVTTLDLRAELPEQPAAGVNLPGLGSRSVSTSISSSSWRDAQEKSLQSELQIWAAVHGYRLASSPTLGRDATSEFVVWRKSYRVGL